MNFPLIGVSPVPIYHGRRAEISQPYGPRDNGTIHPGIDILYRRKAGEPMNGAAAATVRSQQPDRDGGWYMPAGVQALAPWDGVVVVSEEMFHPDGYSRGWGVRIDHGGGWETFVNHIVKGTQHVRKGQRVRAAEPLGEIGGSNDGEGLRHVHLGMWHDGGRVDPGPYFKLWRHVAVSSGAGASIALGLALAFALS